MEYYEPSTFTLDAGGKRATRGRTFILQLRRVAQTNRGAPDEPVLLVWVEGLFGRPLCSPTSEAPLDSPETCPDRDTGLTKPEALKLLKP
jgi:hypothetical protein